MNAQSMNTWTELADRRSDGLVVRLLWTNRGGSDEVVIRVADLRTGDSVDIAAEPGRALDVYYHPFAYRAVNTAGERSRRAA